MSDRLNNELLSAYLDNEVTADERAMVEQALADSPETHKSLESLRQVQARLQAVPRLSLPADFHQRVLAEAERRAAEQAVAVRPGAGPRWLRIAAVVATIAAVLIVALMIANKDQESEIVENQHGQGSGSNGAEVASQDASLPGDNVFVTAGPRPQPKYILVLDLAITKKGQDDDVFGQVMKQAGIAFDARNEGVVLDKKLRDNLLKTRFVAGVDQPAAGKVNEGFDVIDMVYVHGTGAQIDDVHQRMTQNQEVRTVLDVAFKPESTQVLNSIGDRSWSLANAEAAGAPRSYAYRLNVGITLHSTRSGFFAKFPTPGLDVRVLENDGKRGSMTGFSLPIPLDFGGGNQPAQGKVNDDGPVIVEDPIYEILVIRRNLKAGFPQNAQEPAPK